MRSQKQIILDIVRASTLHPTADQVFIEARKEHPGIAMGTVYRNLALLSEEGLLRRVEAPGVPTRFDKTLTPHEHMVCLRCGRVRDMELGMDLLEQLRSATGEDVQSYSLSVEYICQECKAAEA